MKKTLIHIHHTIWITFIFFLMLAALLISAARLATPWLEEQKPLIENWASKLLDQPVQIQQLSINWQGFEPVLRCKQVVIFDDKQSKPLLQVKELDIGVSLIRSMFSGRFRLGHLRINGLHLTVHQDQTGQITISGINAPINSTSATTDNSQAVNDVVSWLFSEPAISLQDVALTWYDKNNRVIPVTGLNFNIKNNGDLHTLWGQAKLAQTISSQLNFTIKLRGDWQNQADLKAKVYLKAQDIILKQWLRFVDNSPVTVQKGLADFELWGTWRKKQWQSWQSLFSVNNLIFTYNPSDKTQSPTTLAIKHLGANLSWQPQTDGTWQLTGNQLQITLAEQPWPELQFALTSNHDFTQQAWQLSYINLNELIPVLLKTHFLPTELQTTITQLQPRGYLYDVLFRYKAAANNNPSDYLLDTQFEQLGINHWRRVPGFTNLTGQLQLIPSGGALQLNSQNAQLDFDKLFRAPINLSSLTARINWQREEEGWNIKADKVALANADAIVNAQLYLLVPKDNSKPYISLLAGYQLLSAKNIADYLPLTELSPDLIKWLNTAILRMTHAQGTLILNGDLKDYPFENNTGTFIADTQIEDTDVAYWPKWPVLKHFSGELLFSGPRMQIMSQSGQILSSQIKQLTATIPNLKKGVPAQLQIDGQLTGDLNDALQFLRESPLNKIVTGINALQARGPLQLQIGLTIPLEHNDPLKVNGQLDTNNAVFSLPKWNLQLPNLQGRFNFTEAGLNSNNVTATLWQKPVSIQIRTLPKSQGMEIQFAGRAAIKDVQKQFNSNLLNSFAGEGNYTVLLEVANKNAPDQMHILSDLKGIAVNLPTPLTKTADQARNFELIANISGAQPFSQFVLNYGDWSAAINKRINSWKINLQSPMVAGNIILPAARNATIQANLQRLYLTDSNTKNSSNLSPQDVPNLYFTCQDFRYGDKTLGAVTLNLKQISNGVAINQLTAIAPSFKLMVNGYWRGQKDHSWTEMAGRLESQNIAAALASWGLPSAGFNSKNSQINFALQWPGAPYDPSFAKMKGNVALNFKEGQLADVGSNSQMKMNIGRLLTFTSWQSIARRVHLDFSDLTQEGYSFNILKGDFLLANGNAVTQNAYLDGPVAKIVVRGRIGLVNEDFDLQLGVTPHLSTSLSVLAGIAGGPVVGIATGAASWVANKVFSKEVDKVAMDHYSLTGPWSKPQVIKQ